MIKTAHKQQTKEHTPYPDFPEFIEDRHFGEFGGRYVPELLMPALEELEQVFYQSQNSPAFKKTFAAYLKDFGGRPTPLTLLQNLSENLGTKIYVKNEGMLMTGAHKFNNALGQALLSKKMGKKKIVAETGAGQHGLAVATVCAKLNLECQVFMGSEDIRRQYANVYHMRQLGANVVAVDDGAKTLKDAVNAAMKYWIENLDSTHYILGSALGPFPFPLIVREFQKIIGQEIKDQLFEMEEGANAIPSVIMACVGGGSNFLGGIVPFLDEPTALIGIEAGGNGMKLGQHAARFLQQKVAICQGYKSYFLQNEDGQIAQTHSISAGLDYAGVAPEVAYHYKSGRVKFFQASDQEALSGFQLLAKNEGILLAMETAHAASFLPTVATALQGRDMDIVPAKAFEAVKKGGENTAPRPIVLIGSGRGDKDIFITAGNLEKEAWKKFLLSEASRL